MGRPEGYVQKRDAVMEALSRAVTRYNRELRSARELRCAMGGRGPRIKRGTGHAALVRYLTDAVLTALNDESWT